MSWGRAVRRDDDVELVDESGEKEVFAIGGVVFPDYRCIELILARVLGSCIVDAPELDQEPGRVESIEWLLTRKSGRQLARRSDVCY